MFSLDLSLPGLDLKKDKELKDLIKALKAVGDEEMVRGGVQSEGDAASYALVWEWGNARQTKKGPKTIRGVNPDGEAVWLSIQAPRGYIAINTPEFVAALVGKLAKMDFGDLDDVDEIIDGMKEASAQSAAVIARLIADAAPVDSGELRDSITPAHPNDPELKTVDGDIETGE
jgi:hypothetical protein